MPKESMPPDFEVPDLDMPNFDAAAFPDANGFNVYAAPLVLERFAVPAPGRKRHCFIPAARLLLTAGIRTAGLLALLPDRELRTLLLLLTFQGADGGIRPSVSEVARAIHASERTARELVRHLETLNWNGQPIVRLVPREAPMGAGLDYWSISPAVLQERKEKAIDLPIPSASAPVSHRQEILALTRSRYARPRAEVEQIVAEQLGYAPQSFADTPEGDVRRRLDALGVPKAKIDSLVASFPLEAITAQIAWLPQRGARNPARFLAAAIRGNYDPPPGAMPMAADQMAADELPTNDLAAINSPALEETTSDGA